MSTTIKNAADAFHAYMRGDFPQCKQCLYQVGGDLQVNHNHAVNDYYANGCRDPQNLLDTLTKYYDRKRKQEKKDKGRRKKEEDDENDQREEQELHVLRYNQALLCVQLRNYPKARHILQELFDNIEPIDDFLAIKICFLLLELCLLTREPDEGWAVIQMLEKPMAFDGFWKHERPRAKVFEAPLMDEEEEGEEGHLQEDEVPNDEPPAAVAAAAESSDVGKPDKQNVAGPLPSLVFGAFLTKHGRAPDTISPAEFKFHCLLYRVRLHLANRHISSAKKASKKAMELLEHDLVKAALLWPHSKTDPQQSPLSEAARDSMNSHQRATVMMLQAYLEYAKGPGNFTKALKLMTRCRFHFADAGEVSKPREGEDDDVNNHIPADWHPTEDDACSSIFYNNIGCMHHMMRKPNLAAYYFSKALTNSIEVPSGSSQPKNRGNKTVLLSARTGFTDPGGAASMHWLDRRAEITFNVGLQFLMTGRSAQASKCFEQVIPVFRNWPRLWIRIAECSIELYRQSRKSEDARQGVTSGASGFQSWNRCKAANGLIPTGGSLCDALGPTALGSGISNLACGAQGFGIHRRLLMMTNKTNMVGISTGEDEERTGPAGAAPAPQGKDDVVSDPLVAAAMALRNVLLLAEPKLQADTDGVSRQSPSSKPGPREMAEIEANLLEDAALLKLAWVCLCQRDHVPAMRYSKRLLEKNNLLPESHGDANSRAPMSDCAKEELKKSWTFQVHNLPHGKDKQATPVRWPSSLGTIAAATNYLTEALLMGGRVLEAQQLMQTFGEKSLGNALKNQAAYIQEQEKNVLSATIKSLHETCEKKEEGLFEGCPAQACGGGRPPSTPMGGLTPPSYLICCAAAAHQGRERDAKGENERETAKDGAFTVCVNYESASFPLLGDMQCIMQTNLAATLVYDGAWEDAQRACERALLVQPRALLPLKTLTYLLIKKGQTGEALRRLKEGQPPKK